MVLRETFRSAAELKHGISRWLANWKSGSPNPSCRPQRPIWSST